MGISFTTPPLPHQPLYFCNLWAQQGSVSRGGWSPAWGPNSTCTDILLSKLLGPRTRGCVSVSHTEKYPVVRTELEAAYTVAHAWNVWVSCHPERSSYRGRAPVSVSAQQDQPGER